MRRIRHRVGERRRTAEVASQQGGVSRGGVHEADERCPIGQGEQLFAALREMGVETEFVRYPGMTHLFPWGWDPVYVADFLTRLVGWFGARL